MDTYWFTLSCSAISVVLLAACTRAPVDGLPPLSHYVPAHPGTACGFGFPFRHFCSPRAQSVCAGVVMWCALGAGFENAGRCRAEQRCALNVISARIHTGRALTFYVLARLSPPSVRLQPAHFYNIASAPSLSPNIIVVRHHHRCHRHHHQHHRHPHA